MSVATLNVACFDATPEASYGTAAATPDKRWPFRANRPEIKPETATDDASLTGVMEESRDSIVVKKTMETSVDYDLRLDALGYWLKMLLGTDVVTGTGPYTHTLTVKQGDSDSLTYFWKDANTSASKLEAFTGVKPTKLSLQGTAGGKWTFNVALKGSGVHTEVTSTAPAQNTDLPLSFSQISAFTLGGSDYKAKLADFSIDIEQTLAELLVAGSITLAGLPRTSFKPVTGKFSLYWDENALSGVMADIEAQTARAMVLTVTSGTQSFSISLPKIVMQNTAVDGQRAINKLPVSFMALYDDSTGKAITATVVNSTAAYT